MESAEVVTRVLRGESVPSADRVNALAEIASNAIKELREMQSRVRHLEKCRDVLCGIANASTKYPAMPHGFQGDWRVLRDEARSVLTHDEDGVWS